MPRIQSSLGRWAVLTLWGLTISGCSRESNDSQNKDALEKTKFTSAVTVATSELAAMDGAITKVKGDIVQLVDLTAVPPDSIPTAVAAVVSLQGVEEVRMKGEYIDDTNILPIAGIRSLKRLRLTDTSITDTVLEKLADRGVLQLLHLQTAKNVTEAGLQKIARISELKDLSLSGPNIDDTIVSAIAKLPNLKKLRLRGTAITGQDFDAIANSSVEDLELAETDFSNAGISAIAKMPKLTKLNLWLTKVDDAGLVPLSNRAQLTSLNLDNMPGITNASIDVILTLPNLTFLHLGKTKVTSDGVLRLSSLKQLKTLHVTNLGIPDDVLGKLQTDMPALENLVN